MRLRSKIRKWDKQLELSFPVVGCLPKMPLTLKKEIHPRYCQRDEKYSTNFIRIFRNVTISRPSESDDRDNESQEKQKRRLLHRQYYSTSNQCNCRWQQTVSQNAHTLEEGSVNRKKSIKNTSRLFFKVS